MVNCSTPRWHSLLRNRHMILHNHKSVKLGKSLTPIFSNIFSTPRWKFCHIIIIFCQHKMCLSTLSTVWTISISLQPWRAGDHWSPVAMSQVASNIQNAHSFENKFNGTFYLSKHHLKSIFPANLYGHHFQQAAKSEKILSEFVVQFYFFKATNFSFQDHT